MKNQHKIHLHEQRIMTMHSAIKYKCPRKKRMVLDNHKSNSTSKCSYYKICENKRVANDKILFGKKNQT
jgi:hypothetical protein